MSQRAVVGQEQQPFRVLVKSPHGKQSPRRFFYEIKHGLLLFVFRGRNNALRLVEHEIGVFFILAEPAVHCHCRFTGIDLRLRFFYDRTVHTDSSFFQILFCLAAGQPRRLCQIFVQPSDRLLHF